MKKTRFYDFWVTSLQKGVFEPEPDVQTHPPLRETVSISYPEKKEDTEIHLYQSVALGTGRHANNPWLQELPDPVSKVVWENYAALSPRFAAENNLTDFDVIEINGRIVLRCLSNPARPMEQYPLHWAMAGITPEKLQTAWVQMHFRWRPSKMAQSGSVAAR